MRKQQQNARAVKDRATKGADTASRRLDGTPPKRPSAPGERFRAPARLVGSQAEIRTRLPVLLLSAATLACCCLMFPMVNWWPLAYVCLVPWLVCVCTARRARFVYFVSYLLGLGYFLINVRWMIPTTVPGYLAMCFYFAVFFPLAAWPIRHMYRRHRVSVALTVPIVWVAMEYLRSITPLGFPWLLLGHTHYRQLTMIQISDLIGAYGVSLVLAMVNGWITDLLIQPILIWRADHAARLPIGTLTTLLVLLGTIIYGIAQRSPRYFEPGPKVAVIQHDFPMYVDPDRAGRLHPETMFEAYLTLARKAATEKPDLIVLPETAMQGFINEEFLEAPVAGLEAILKRRYPQGYPLAVLKYYQGFGRRIRNAFQHLSTESGASIVLGSAAIEWKPTQLPPHVVEAFNSAFLLVPGRDKPVARYDKIHLVLFGEYVPFRYSYPWLYEWLNAITPWGRDGRDYSLTPGSRYQVFEFESAAGRESRDLRTHESKDETDNHTGTTQPIELGRRYRAGVPICYEEIMPYIAREFSMASRDAPDQKGIDLLLSISNDGWFFHPAELEQHLAAAVFRAVENRIAVARSVNTGASAIIHPNGEIFDRVELSPEQRALLEPVAAALGKLRDLARQMEEQVRADSTAYQATWNRFIEVRSAGLRESLLSLGKEFTFINERLGPLMPPLSTQSPQQCQRAARRLREQIEDDLLTIADWEAMPWTAPGCCTAQVKLDSRITLYSRWGDWFAQGAVALVLVMLVDWLLRRIRPAAGAKAKEGKHG